VPDWAMEAAYAGYGARQGAGINSVNNCLICAKDTPYPPLGPD